MKISTTVSYHLIPMRMDIIKMTNCKYYHTYVEEGSSHMGVYISTASPGSRMEEVPQSTKKDLSCDPAAPQEASTSKR